MDSVGVNVIETAALGRPFQLGMLYDCRKDALVPGITLWDKEQLQQSIRDHAQINTDFNVTASDSIEEKSHLLNIDGSLKLSLLSGLVNVRGAAKYLSDTKKSFKQQRMTLHYHSTTKFEELTMNHLASGNIAHYEAFNNDAATHVVTAVLYGANACFVFDREVSSDEDKTTIDGEVKAAFDKLKGISLGAEVDLNMNDNQKTAAQKFSCTFYGDFQLPSNPTSFEDALKIFADLPKLLGEKKELAVPLRVWLYPLDKLHTSAAKVQRDISTGLIKALEMGFESLSTTEMKCSDLLREPPALAFAAFYDQIMQMKENCCSYKLSLMKTLGFLLPEIRGDKMKETELNNLLRDHMESPFRGQDLEQWVKEKEKESAIIKTLIRQLNDCGAKVEVNLDEILMDLEVENVVCYTFTSFEGSDVLLSTQKDYLSPNGQKIKNGPRFKQMTGLSSNAKKNMRTNMIIFKNLINSKQQAKFIVASKEMKHIPGSCILIYENGSDEDICFTSPSKPARPVIEQIKGHNVVLKVSPTCEATEELRLMFKMKGVEDWKSQRLRQSQDTVTLTDLSPDTEYEIKYTVVGKLNYTVDSDVIHIRVIDKKLISAAEFVLESLTVTENKCSKLMDDSSSKIYSAFNIKIQDMMKYCQTYKQDLNTRIQSLIQSIQACEKDICVLADLLQAHEESPFKATSLSEWFNVKETELNVVNTILQQLLDSGAEENSNLDTTLSDINVENVVCYTFSSLEQPDELLSAHENYLKHQMMRRDLEKMPKAVSQTWLQGTIREKMREHFKIFKDIMTSHSSQSTKFLVSSKDHTIHPGSCILLYENGSNEAICFNPPSKPACPSIKQVRGHSVVFKVPSLCPVTVELKLLYKIKEEGEWKSQHVHKSQNTITLTDLSPDTQYEMKYEAVGRLNYTVDSDVIRVTTVNTEEECKSSERVNSLQECQTEDEILKQLTEVLIEMGNILDADESFKMLCETSNRFSWTSCLLLTFKWINTFIKLKKPGSSNKNMQPLNYSFILTGDTHKFHMDFIDALNRETLCLRKVSTEQESDFILHFCYVSALSDSLTDGHNYSKTTDKPVVLVVLHNTMDSDSVPNSSVCVDNPDVFKVDCIFCDFEGLHHCQINRSAVIAVSHWLNTKLISLRTVRQNATGDEHKTVAPS